jgi:hypothetical protein
VTLLACSVWAEMVNISQIVTSSAAGPSQATTVLSAILFMAILLLVIMLPVAFFRVKVQDAREHAQFHQVLGTARPSRLPASMRVNRSIPEGGKKRCEVFGVATRNDGDPTTCAT